MFLIQTYHSLFQSVHLRRSIGILRELEHKLPAPQTRLAIPFLFKGSGFFRRIRPLQSQWEIGELYQRVYRQRPRVVLEIGTARGGTLYLWCQAASPDALLVSVDLPDGQFGGGYRECRTTLYQAFTTPGQKLSLLRADSHDPKTLAQVREILGARPVDFLFIDADHTYEGVKQDFELYSTLVKPGGLIGFHDIAPEQRDKRVGVPRFWQELKQRYARTTEWLDAMPNARQIGIGLIEWPEAGDGR